MGFHFPGGGGISNVVEDTTPQLGGDLDCQSNDINSVANLNVIGQAKLTDSTDTYDSLLPFAGDDKAYISGDEVILRVTNSLTQKAIFGSTGQTLDGSLYINERAAAQADVAGDGQIWVKSDTPNTLWFTDDAGNDFQVAVKAPWIWQASAAGLLAKKPEAAAFDGIAPTNPDVGTNLTAWNASFDDTDDEARDWQCILPSDIDTSGSVTFKWVWSSRTATSGNVMLSVGQKAIAEGESWDQALTTHAASADAVQGTVDQVTITTLTVSVSTLGWAAGDFIMGTCFRDGDHASDTMTGDLELHEFAFEVPRT